MVQRKANTALILLRAAKIGERLERNHNKLFGRRQTEELVVCSLEAESHTNFEGGDAEAAGVLLILASTETL